MILGGLSACTQDASLPINSQSPITIGVSQSTSGNFVSDSAATLQGYQLWVNTVNNNGGLLGRPVKLVVLPDDSTQQKVQDNYKITIRS